jgi:adhesin transport system membrane fusion protein
MPPTTHKPPFTNPPDSLAMMRSRTPRIVRWISRILLVGVIMLPFVLVFVPWQQTLRGRGQIVAYAPTERKQVVTALIGGQIRKWHVVEGSQVKIGDAIADIDDNDADLASRLDAQRAFLFSRKKAAQEEVAEQQRAVEAQVKAQDAAIRAAKANRDAVAKLVDVADQGRKNAEFAKVFELRRYEMFDKLFRDKQFGGLESELNRDEAKMRSDRAATDLARAEADYKRSEAALISGDATVYQTEATALSTLATNRRDVHRAEQNLFAIERELQEIDNRIERFKARYVKSPCDGTVFRISANASLGGQFVKEGDELAVIVPETSDRVVELMIDGVDAPLIAAQMETTGRGPHVRLQFEGWPAVQFAGWPSVATGTFGGRVRQIDMTDDGFGRFRILVEAEELYPGDQWPDAQYLRQGNQAIGWVFLNRVTVGYEVWRQLNGFPPVIAPKPPEYKGNPKPLKIKAG